MTPPPSPRRPETNPRALTLILTLTRALTLTLEPSNPNPRTPTLQARGRQSGSVAWRTQRGETGKAESKDIDVVALTEPPPGWHRRLQRATMQGMACVGAATVEQGGGAVLTPAETGQVGAGWTLTLTLTLTLTPTLIGRGRSGRCGLRRRSGWPRASRYLYTVLLA